MAGRYLALWNLLLTNTHPVSLGKGDLILLELFGIWAKPAIRVEVSSVRSPNTDVGVHCVRRHGNDGLLRACKQSATYHPAAERHPLRHGLYTGTAVDFSWWELRDLRLVE